MKCYSYDISETDLMSAYRLHQRTETKAWIFAAAMLFAIFSSPAWLQHDASLTKRIIFIVIALIASGYAVIAGVTGKGWFVSRLSKANIELLCQPTEICWDDSGVEFSTQSTQAKLPWSIFESWKVDSQNLILYRGNNSFNFVKLEGQHSAEARQELLYYLESAGIRGTIFQ